MDMKIFVVYEDFIAHI